MQRWCVSFLVAIACFFAVSRAFVGDAAASVPCGFVTQRTQCGDLACDAEKRVCVMCNTDADCYPSGMYCLASNGKCKLRGFFSNLHFLSVVSLIGAVITCSVAVIAGVGGGGILVPMFTAMMKVPMKTAVGLSQSTICGQSTLNMYLLVQRKYPDSTWDRPLINYQYLSLALPLGLIGTHVGSILSKLCPDLLRLVLLFALLTAVLYRTINKVRAQYSADTQAAEAVVEGSTPDNQTTAPAAEATIAATSRASHKQFPEIEIATCFASFFIVLACQLLMRMSDCGGFFYWVFVLIPLCALIAIFYRSYQRLSSFAATQPELMMFQWTPQSSVYYPLVAVFAGAGAAMLGIGGGLVLGFVLYEILVPEEASATSGAATFFLSFSAAIPQVFSGVLPIDYGLILAIVGLGSTSLGQFVIMDYIRKNGLHYLIVASLGLIAGGSLCCLGGYGIYNAVIVSRNGSSVFATGRLCG